MLSVVQESTRAERAHPQGTDVVVAVVVKKGMRNQTSLQPGWVRCLVECKVIRTSGQGWDALQLRHRKCPPNRWHKARHLITVRLCNNVDAVDIGLV